MSLRLDKPWTDLASLDPDELPGQLGVFQLGDQAGEVLYIGYAGGKEAFGLRTAIVAERARIGTAATHVRWELTHGYLSRWEELMMVHRFDHGAGPVANDPEGTPAGRLKPGA